MPHRNSKALLCQPAVQPAGKPHCHAVNGPIGEGNSLSSGLAHCNAADIRSAFELLPFL